MHWIDEAEQNKNKRERKKKVIHSKIDQKKDDVKLNWEKNKESYLAAINKLEGFIRRINELPRESRLEFGRIELKEKESSLHNHLIKYTSSRRRIIRRFDGLFAPFKAKHYKNTRNIFLSLSREFGYVLIESKEINAPRIRLNEEEDGAVSSLFRLLKRKDKSFVQRAKNKINIADFDDSFILYFIDFLAFKNNGKKYFFVNNTTKEFED